MKKNQLIKNLKNEYLGRAFSTICGFFIVLLTLAIIFFITSQGIKTFTVDNYSVIDFLFSTNWAPGKDTPSFGALIFIVGSTLVSIGAVLVSAPIGIALAIFMNIISPKLGNKVLQPTIELFVGIPSVIYGWLGVSILLPLLKFQEGSVGASLIAGIIVLSIMILPTIASLASDAIRGIPHEFIEASYGLGATRWQTIYKVVVPAAKSGILTGVVLGLARAFGEALAVQMVIGNTIKLPNSLLSPTTTLTSILTMDMANTPAGTPWNDALWSLSLILLVISFVFILLIKKIGSRGEN